MLHLPDNGRQIYEVSIYNKEVRALVKENQSHSYFDDFWADIRIQDVIARNEVEARKLIAKRFPPEDGFVIQDIHRGEI